MPLEHPGRMSTGCKCTIVDVTSNFSLSSQLVMKGNSQVKSMNMPLQHSMFLPHLMTGILIKLPQRSPRLSLMMNKGRHLRFLQHHYDPEQGDVSPEDAAKGEATRIVAKERMTQTPPLLSRLIQGYLDHTGIEACPYHQMDHGVRDPVCDHCKRALGPLYHHKIVGNRHLPVFTFDFSGPHPHKVNMAQYLLVSVWSLGHMRIIWAFGVESRQSSVVLPCLQSCFEDLRALTGGSRPPILRLHSDKVSF